MTWEQWCNSSYNSKNIYAAYGSEVMNFNGSLYSDDSNERVDAYDVIVSGDYYIY